MGTTDAFTKLNQDIPDWLSKLDELSEQVTNQNKRFDRLSGYPDQQLFKQKTGSTESLRPREDVDNSTHGLESQDGTSPPCSKAPSQKRAHTPQKVPEEVLGSKSSPRKRKPASSLFATSGPARYRTKSMIIVYYDSAIQEGFESLVRSIASSRNALRKGKLEAGYRARLASLGMEESPFPAGGEFGMLDARGFRPRLERKAVTADLLKEEVLVPAIEVIDRDLEKAQGYCEIAAHQYLRVGHCDGEILGSRESFEKCLELSKKETHRLQEVRQRLSQQEKGPVGQHEAATDIPRTISPNPEHPPEKSEPLAKGPTHRATMDVIEVDDGSDDDDDSIQVDLSAFRRTRAG